MPEWIFDEWGVLLRTLVVGIASYVALVAVIRISGKRTLSKMNAFDLIVTVAIGSTLASVLINREVALAEGLLALALLVALQFCVAFLSMRVDRFAHLVKSEPTLVVRSGQMLQDAMRRERVAAVEIEQVARQHGIARVEEVEAMVLESDGSFSVVGGVPRKHAGITQAH